VTCSPGRGVADVEQSTVGWGFTLYRLG
jgi:hypothetical protein